EVRLGFQGLWDEVRSARPGHANVAQHEGDTVAAELLQRFVARTRRVHLELLLRQVLSERVADGLLIVHDENLEAPRRLDHAPLLCEAPGPPGPAARVSDLPPRTLPRPASGSSRPAGLGTGAPRPRGGRPVRSPGCSRSRTCPRTGPCGRRPSRGCTPWRERGLR